MRRAAIDGGEGFARRFRDAAQHRKGLTMAPKAPNGAWKPRRGAEVNAPNRGERRRSASARVPGRLFPVW